MLAITAVDANQDTEAESPSPMIVRQTDEPMRDLFILGVGL